MSPLVTGASRSILQYSSNAKIQSASDQYFSNVSLLLHMDGTNGSTSFPDSSSNSFSISRYVSGSFGTTGIAEIRTDQSKFGGASCYFSSNSAFNPNSVLIVPDNSAFEYGSGNFTLEFFARFTAFGSGGSGYTIYNKNDAVRIWGDPYGNGRIFTQVRDTASTYIINPGASTISNISLNTWHHYALTRSGNTFYVFWNGNLIYTYTSSVSIMSASGSSLYLGAGDTGSNGYDNFQGYLDEVRITKGIARYTSSFTVPTAAFPNS